VAAPVHDTDPDVYRSVDDGPETEVRIQGSRFLGRAFRIADAETAAGHVAAVRREHHAATHHGWALRAGLPGSVVERSDDDGEPAGTTGRPILARIRARDLHRTLVVVTRYFGGTRLGTGGLARAYAEAADLALDAAPERTVPIVARIEVSCEFDDVGTVEGLVAGARERVLEVAREYDPRPRFLITVRQSASAGLARAIVEATAARAAVRSV
jgi:uncharacterized YigZ family protein